ncbi:Reductase, putative [Giardia lamblia P15]|uniref:Reductase, putative n=1 Tax=Giardia intestinalis (strain P15) TaxID=658858 RepID=E1F1E2_GIAIA|nr:Reductase, putative [Giardia lamblia P15]
MQHVLQQTNQVRVKVQVKESLKLKMFVILLVLGIFLYVFSRRRGKKLRHRYPGRYAIVLGATGGLGTSFCKRLLNEEYSLIVSGRSLQSINGLINQLNTSDDKLIPFPYDASCAAIGNFSTKFNELLTAHAINQDDIAMVIMAAGFGEYSSFEDTTLEHKLSLLTCDFAFPVEVSDYFYKQFCVRNKTSRKRAALIYISSCLAVHPGPNFALYHASKAGVSALASSLYMEAGRHCIDVLAVHPGTINDSNFFQRPEMHFGDLPRTRKLGHTKLLSLTTTQIVDETFKYLGLCAHLHVGLTSCMTVALYSLVPRSIICWLIKRK